MAAGSGRVSVDDRRRQGCGGAGVALYVGRVLVRVSVQDLRSHVRAGDTMGSVYRCDMRSVQQQRGGPQTIQGCRASTRSASTEASSLGRSV